jgi:hypothetical protein
MCQALEPFHDITFNQRLPWFQEFSQNNERLSRLRIFLLAEEVVDNTIPLLLLDYRISILRALGCITDRVPI